MADWKKWNKKRFLIWGSGMVVVLAILWLGVAMGGVWLVSTRDGMKVVSWLRGKTVSVDEKEVLPAIDWGEYENLELVTADGELIVTTVIAHDDEESAIKKGVDDPVVLLMHGKGGSRKSMLKVAEWWYELGADVVLITLRGHGDSSGEWFDGYGVRLDAERAVRFIKERFGERPLILHGQSMGAGAAMYMDEKVAEGVDGYVFDCLYDDMRHAIRNRAGMYLPWGVEWMAYETILVGGKLWGGEVGEMVPLDYVEGLPRDAYVAFVPGKYDEHAKAVESDRMYDKLMETGIAGELTVLNGGHTTLEHEDPEGYKKVIERVYSKVRSE
ncbi:alpha/beta fold hydrolase [Planctomycetota bacterium]|nr:alpha/beta fold hydrolase [Planctomycetota bacterium]